LTGDLKVGVQIIIHAISSPLKQIAENAGAEGAVVYQRVLEMQGNMGYNALTNTYEDLLASGIIDPTKVARLALTNAASIAAMLLTMEAAITDLPEEKKEHQAMPVGGMDY